MGKRKNSFRLVNKLKPVFPVHISHLISLLYLFVRGPSAKSDLLLHYIANQPFLFRGLLEFTYNVYLGFFKLSILDKARLKRNRVIFDTLLNSQLTVATKKRFISSNVGIFRNFAKTVLKYV